MIAEKLIPPKLLYIITHCLLNPENLIILLKYLLVLICLLLVKFT